MFATLRWLLAVLFLLLAAVATLLGTQGIPLQPTQAGTITGSLKDSQGRPAAGVRVAAVARPTSMEELGGAAMSSIAETDSQGRFVLENVPPGRYYISAGRLDFPTYFPGTQAMGEGTLVTVAAGATVPGIDFTMRDSSAGRADAGVSGTGSLTIPLSVRVESGKVPVFADGKFTTLRLVAPGGVITAPLTQPSLSIFGSDLQPDYQLDVEGLPPGYSVKSMEFGATTLQAGRLTLLPNLLPAAPRAQLQTLFNALWSVGTGVQAAVQTLTITLSRAASPARKAATVAGAIKPGESRAVYISGTPGSLYVDGTFEFRDVPPGTHVLVASGPKTGMTVLGSLIVVGSNDMTGIELEPMAIPPANFNKSQSVRASNGRTPGPIPLATVRGQITDIESGQPVTMGSIFLIGEGWVERELASDGKFEFPRLLPGQYEIEVKGVGYPTFRRALVVEEKDIVLDLTAG
jgi:hypothetical protein